MVQHQESLTTLRARIGAHSLHAKYDGREITARARSAFLDRFYQQTDPELSHAERLRRAEHLLRAHMQRLALKSAKARREAAAS